MNTYGIMFDDSSRTTVIAETPRSALHAAYETDTYKNRTYRISVHAIFCPDGEIVTDICN